MRQFFKLEKGKQMRKIIIAASMALFFAACGSDDHPVVPSSTNPAIQGNTTEIKLADIVKYFAFDKQMNVYQALEKAKVELEKKTIDGKEVRVTAVEVVKSDEQKGTFTLKVTGSCGNKSFVKEEVDFDGFAQKPTDYEMATRTSATWKSGVDYLCEFDFDMLYRMKDTRKFTASYLQKYINLASSSVDGSKHYTFTPEDWAKTTISDVRYVGGLSSGSIAFTITYNGKKGRTGNGNNGSPSLIFDENQYYAKQIGVNTEAVSKLYMRGVFEHADVFYTSLLKFDHDKFVPHLEVKYRSDSENTVTLSIKLAAKDGKDTELAKFTLIITGFKPLSALNNELSIANSTEVGKYFGKHFREKINGDYTAEVKNLPVQVWFKDVQMAVKREGKYIELKRNKVKSENRNSEVTAWIPTSNAAKDMDIYLLDPRIEILSATKKDNFLDIKYKLIYVNDIAVDGSEHTLNVHLLAP